MQEKLERIYKELKVLWSTMPNLEREVYDDDFDEFVRAKGSEFTDEDNKQAQGRTHALSNAVACGYVSYKDGEYVKNEGEPDWKHPSLRTEEENKIAFEQATKGW